MLGRKIKVVNDVAQVIPVAGHLSSGHNGQFKGMEPLQRFISGLHAQFHNTFSNRIAVAKARGVAN
jgi:hypothetical protein